MFVYEGRVHGMNRIGRHPIRRAMEPLFCFPSFFPVDWFVYPNRILHSGSCAKSYSVKRISPLQNLPSLRR